MSGNVQITTRGHAAIASPEQLGQLDSFITYAMHEFEHYFGADDAAGTDDVRSLLMTAKRLVANLKYQLDEDHQYILSGPAWDPVFAHEIAEGRADAEQALAERATAPRRLTPAELARELNVSRQAIHDLQKRGKLGRDADGLLDLELARVALLNRLHPKAKTVPAAELKETK